MADNIEEGKFIKDVIHGYIEISPICMKIIDTPEFQRLRHIKQLGFVYFVYPSANHTRFEHSIGVSHLAGEMARTLLKSCEIDNKESWIKCAKIAGLCHDLGHGPFSHVYETHVSLEFKHEKRSVEVVENLCQRFPEITDEEKLIIKAMILPEENKEFIKKYKDRKFMFQIVSNDENGIDVDKWDYLTRDAYYLGLPSTFEHMRLIAHARAIEVEGEKQTCYPLKLKEHIWGMYHLRRWQYKHAYLHRVVFCINEMFADAIKESGIKINDDDTDKIYYDLQETSLIKRVEKRKLYVSLDEIRERELFEGKTEKDIQEMIKERTSQGVNAKLAIKELAIEKYLGKFQEKNPKARNLRKEDLRVDIQKFKYGKKATEAFKKIYFYRKGSPGKAEALRQEEVKLMFSEELAETTYLFFSTKEA